jgi:hypothetical protein
MGGADRLEGFIANITAGGSIGRCARAKNNARCLVLPFAKLTSRISVLDVKPIGI